MAETTKLHSQEDIGDLLAVATGLKIGHYFSSHLDYPVIIFQSPDETFGDADILATQELLTQQLDEAYVYDGVVYPEVALTKAIRMVRENAMAKLE